MSHKIEIAGGVAVALRYVIHAVEARKDWSPEQKQWIPLVCVALGAIVAAAALVAGMPFDEALIVGGGAPGAVVVNELLGSRKPPVPPAALVLVAFLAGCAPAWQTGAALVSTAHVAVKGYQAYTHDARRAILAASGCRDVPACEAALEPFNERQADVLACLEAMAPLVDAAALAAEARDVKAAGAVVPALAAKVPACVVEIQKVKR